jgi:hypothetical protein
MQCRDSPAPDTDSGIADAAIADASSNTDAADASPDSAIGPMGGTVDRFRFGMFGDVRPPNQDQTAMYPTAVINSVLSGMQGLNVQFAVASGDYMFASTGTIASTQVQMLLDAERSLGVPIFHALGNHECTGATATNCPNGTETGNIQVFHSMLAPAYSGVYYDWYIHTSMGDAHFIATAPNAWNPTQQSWLTAALAQPAQYIFVIAHEPPSAPPGPGSVAIEDAIAASPQGVTLRLYGHTHSYRHLTNNSVISGNAGAPLAGTGGTYGFVTVEQQADGNVQVSAWDVGQPPTMSETFLLSPTGQLL